MANPATSHRNARPDITQVLLGVPLKYDPSPMVVWRNGLLVRGVFAHLPVAVLAWRSDMGLAYLVVATLIELLCLRLYYRAAYRRDPFCYHPLSYLGDIVWFVAALCFEVFSGMMPPWGYAAINSVWGGSVLHNLAVASRLNVAKLEKRLRKSGLIRDEGGVTVF